MSTTTSAKAVATPSFKELESRGIKLVADLSVESGQVDFTADVVKLNLPSPDPTADSPAPYNELQVTQEEAVDHVVSSAGSSLVVLSGGSKIDDDKLLEQTRYIMEAGGSGVIYGRNVWQRGHSEAMEIVEQIKEIMLASVRRTP